VCAAEAGRARGRGVIAFLAALVALAVVAVTVLAAALRRASGALARARAARRRAREVNDDVVQALVLALYALDRGDVDKARRMVDDALGRARGMLPELSSGESVARGDLRRELPAALDS